MSEVSGAGATGRRQQIVLALVGISRVTGGAIFGTAMAVYIGRQGSPLMVSLAYAVFSVGLLVFAPVWGAVADVTGRRRAIVVGTAFLSALAVAPLTTSVTVPLQIACRGVFALFSAGFQSTILTIVSELGDASERGRSVGFYSSTRAGGSIGGRLLVGYLLGILAPTALYLFVTLVCLLAAAICTLLVDPTPTSSEPLTVGSVLQETRGRLLPRGERRELLRENGLGWLYVGLMLRNVTEKGFAAVVPVYLVSDVGLSAVTMGAVLAVSPGLRTVSMYLFGRLADVVGRKRLIVGGLGGSGVQCLVVVAALLPGTLLLRAGVSGLAFAVHAVTYSALTTGTLAFIGDVAPVDRESELIGLRSTARGVGGVVGPLTVGVLATAFDYATAFLCISSLAFLAAVLVARTVVDPYEPRTAGLFGFLRET